MEIVAVAEMPTSLSMYKTVLDPEYVRAQEHEAAQNGLNAALRDIDVAHAGVVVDGLASTALSELSRRTDLLVLGSRNWGPVRRLMVGSTSHAVVAHAASAVLVLPRGTDTEEPAADAFETQGVSQPTV